MTNLRGEHVRFSLDGNRFLCGVVITRIRGTRWMIESSELPRDYQRPDGSRRIMLDRSEFTIASPETVRRMPRSPIEAMIDKACGLP